MAKRSRYQQFERMMGSILVIGTVLFLVYLIAAAAGILWLKVITAVVCMLGCVGSLVLLYLSRELLRQRSLWLSCGFFSLFLCILVSLILAFP